MKKQTNMTIEALSTCMTQMPEQAVRKLLDLLSLEELTIVRGPLTGLVMMSALDSFQADFYLGEVLVTEAEVTYGECRGYGMVIGNDSERAVARASVEAIGLSPNRILYERVKRFLQAEATKLETRRKKEAALIARTRVDFETMKRT